MVFAVVGVAVAEMPNHQNGGLASWWTSVFYLHLELLLLPVLASVTSDFRLPVTFIGVGVGFFETLGSENSWLASEVCIYLVCKLIY